MKPRDVLIAHARLNESECACGWAVWGESHADHVIQMLEDAGYEVTLKPAEGKRTFTLHIGPPKPEIRYIPVPTRDGTTRPTRR